MKIIGIGVDIGFDPDCDCDPDPDPDADTDIWRMQGLSCEEPEMKTAVCHSY